MHARVGVRWFAGSAGAAVRSRAGVGPSELMQVRGEVAKITVSADEREVLRAVEGARDRNTTRRTRPAPRRG